MTEASRPPSTPNTEEEGLQLVGFMLGAEEYAVNILDVVSIERPQNVLRLPRMPDFVEGVMRIRDEVVPLVKLRTRFGLEERPIEDETRVVVVETEGQTVGFIVDWVTAVRRSLEARLDPAPAMSLTVESRFVEGVLSLEDRTMILLNPYRVLLADEAQQLGRASAVARHYLPAEE